MNQLIDWISKNKEWLFSGVGVILFIYLRGRLIALIGTVTRIFNKVNEIDRRLDQIQLVKLEEFMEIEKKAEREVWILSYGYYNEKKDYVKYAKLENLQRGVKYKYFIPQDIIKKFLGFFKWIKSNNSELLENIELFKTYCYIPASIVIIDPEGDQISTSKMNIYILIEREQSGGSWLGFAKLDASQATVFYESFMESQENNNLIRKIDIYKELE